MLSGAAVQDQPDVVGDDPLARVPVECLTAGHRFVQLVATKFDWEELGVSPSVIPSNCARLKKRLDYPFGSLEEPAAIVGYGESLHQTWEHIKRFRIIFTCSGSHQFLLERGIVPTYHVDSDPRAYKAKLVGTPHPSVTYLPASICHPDYFDLLERYEISNVYLWHLLFFEPEIYALLPKGEWLLTGGNTVGSRTMKIARLLGYADQHLFGFDGCAGYAGVHYNGSRTLKRCDYDGKTYWTTYNWASHAQMLFTDLDRMPETRTTFYGEGLVQAMAKNYVRKPVTDYPMGIRR